MDLHVVFHLDQMTQGDIFQNHGIFTNGYEINKRDVLGGNANSLRVSKDDANRDFSL